MLKISQEEEIQITAEDKESWFQNSIPLLEKYEVPLGSYPYYRQLANISNSERSYLIQVNGWGKQIFQVKHGLDNAQDFETMKLLKKSPGFFHFPEDRIKDYIRFAQQQPDLYENYNWTFYNAIIDNPSFFQNDNNRKNQKRFKPGRYSKIGNHRNNRSRCYRWLYFKNRLLGQFKLVVIKLSPNWISNG